MAARTTRRNAIVVAVVLAVGGVIRSQGVRIPPGQTVYVVATRDSDLLTLCADGHEPLTAGQRPWRPKGKLRVHHLPSGRQVLTFLDTSDSVILPEPAGACENRPPERAVSEPLELNRVAWDRTIERSIEQEFRRFNRYTIADSAEKADYVFLAEGVYTSVASRTGSMATLTNINGDVQANVLEAVLAILVPAARYRQVAGDIPALVAARLWEGSSVFRLQRGETDQASEPLHSPLPPSTAFGGAGGNQPVPASPASLVRQLHNKEKRPRTHPPICAAAGYAPSSGRMDWPISGSRPIAHERAKEPSVPAPDTNPRSAGRPTFAVGVTYVSVPTIVTDGEGRLVFDLKESDFRVYEDGAQQRVAKLLAVSEPFDVAVLIDTSDSMRFAIEDVRKAALAFGAAVRAEDRLMLVSFDNRILVWSDLTSDGTRTAQLITGMRKGGGTRLYDAIDLVTRQRLNDVARRKALVLFTDGIDTRSRLADAQQALATVSEIPAYVIQYDTSKDGWRLGHPVESRDVYAKAIRFLHDLSERAGGRFYSAGSIESLREAFGQIARELSGQYTLYYSPSNQERDGAYRRIRVEVDREGLTVRARPGYRASPGNPFSSFSSERGSSRPCWKGP